MSIELLIEGASDKLDDKQRQLLNAAGEELSRLKSLISDLLDLSKIESGKVEMVLEPVLPNMLADKAVEIFQAQARQKKIDLSCDVPEGLPEVLADPNKITWVLTNLIANALRFANGSVAVSASHAGQWVHFSVADDGEGIDRENQSRIFEKFVQVKSAKSVGGTGLGLTICKEIVRSHKGTIWVESTPGRGSTFTFTLPVARQK
jgi:NtrC-family two-component system sensor histidine kinase KinB